MQRHSSKIIKSKRESGATKDGTSKSVSRNKSKSSSKRVPIKLEPLADSLVIFVKSLSTESRLDRCICVSLWKTIDCLFDLNNLTQELISEPHSKSIT